MLMDTPENELPEDNLPEEAGAARKSSSGKTQEEIHAEIRAMAEKSKQNTQHKLFDDTPDLEEDEDELSGFSLRNIADRDESHRLYFGMYNVMKRNLPKGKANEPLRRYVYDEVLLYLNQGKRKDARGVRGSSGQMAYIPTILNPAFAIVLDWVKKGANPFDLYSAFEAENIALGYHPSGTPPPSTGSAGTPPVPTPTTPISTAPATQAVQATAQNDAE